MMRKVLELTGSDATPFLQSLVTNDINKRGLVYTALLTPQGKFMLDFFVLNHDDALWIDVAADHAAGLAQRLTMYRLRADVVIAELDITVSRGTGDAPIGAYPDPRSPAMGWRDYGEAQDMPTDWDALRVAQMVPQLDAELGPDSYILEMGFERLNGVDFKKGCYVGQEIVARMKHKTELRKGLARVSSTEPLSEGAEITSNGKPVGTVHTVSGTSALAYLRFDRANEMISDGINVTLEERSV
jgi:tRNA-modifying protein YgfZ